MAAYRSFTAWGIWPWHMKVPMTCAAGDKVLPDPAQDLVKVGGGAAEAGGAKEKDLLVRHLGQKIADLLGAGALVGPEAHIEHVGLQGLGVGSAAVEALGGRQSLPDGLGQEGGVAGSAAVDDGVTHVVSFLS